MKLLSWMNRKNKHNATDSSLKTFSIEDYAGFPHATFDEQRHHADPTFSFAHLKQPKCQNFEDGVKHNKMDDIKEEESFNELFEGFLSIGTLGLEPLNTEPPTPTFPETFEDKRNEEMQVTGEDLKLINEKLEKLLEAETEEAANETSERSSHASIITLSNDQTEELNAEEHRNMITCPLQKYLFGSSIELSETDVQTKKEKTSLAELFKRNRVHEHLEGTHVDLEKQVKGTHVTHFMKKMLKRLLSTSTTSKAPNNDTNHSALIKRKLPKVLKIFRRRVHPDGVMVEKKLTKPYTKKIEKIFCKCGYQDEEAEENEALPQRANPTEDMNSFDLSFNTTSGVSFTSTREHWIKTDDDYLVLEL